MYGSPSWRCDRLGGDAAAHGGDFGLARTSTSACSGCTIPESLDYDGLFDDLFEKYTKSCVLERVKTSNMGTLYELTYRVTLPDDHAPKAFLDELRCRNGNLNITCGREATKDAL